MPVPTPTGVTPLPLAVPAPVLPPPQLPGRTVTFQKPPAPEPKPGEPKVEVPAGPKEKSEPGGALPDKPGEAPARELVFRLSGDDELNKRVLTELNPKADAQKAAGYKFPAGQPLVPAGTQYVPKTYSYPVSQSTLEPTWVAHRRLYFEQMNSERGLWDAGLLQPVFSTAHFYKDVLFWPHAIGSAVCHDRYDASAGKCLPGDPTPLYLYPPGFTAGGLLLQATTVTGFAFIFP